jgi:hypothetical protein
MLLLAPHSCTPPLNTCTTSLPLLLLLLAHAQEGDLKYMVAFSSARAALEWCLLVQEASMYLAWPAGLSKIPQVQPVLHTPDACNRIHNHQTEPCNPHTLSLH